MKVFRKVLSVCTVIAMLGGMACMSVSAAENPTISVSSKTVLAGATVDVNVSLENNPGIVSMLLNVNYDSDALTLINVTDAEVLGNQSHSNDLSLNPYILYWNNGTATTNFTQNGKIATLTFKVNDNAPDKDYPITITYDKDNDAIFNLNFEPVNFTTTAGKISVVKMICGDVNGDMKVSPLDTVILARYLAKWTGYDALPYTK